MSGDKFGLCIVSDEADIVQSVENAISGRKNIRSKVVSKPIANLNGKAISTMSDNDAIVFDIKEVADQSLDALKEVLASNSAHTPVIALTDGQISLSKVRQLNQMGIEHVLPIPVTKEEILNIIDKVENDRNTTDVQSQNRPKGTVIGVGHANGGSGATTLAVNLALALLNRKGVMKKRATKSVALVDLDLQFGTVKLSLDLENTNGIMSVISSDATPDEAFIDSIMTEHASGLSVLVAPENPVPLDSMMPEQIEATLQILRKNYDYVVLDLPTHIVGWMEPVINSLDNLYMLTDLTVPGVLQTKRMLSFYEDGQPDLKTTLVVNKDKKPVMGNRRLKEAQEVLGQKVEIWLPEDDANARGAMNVGIPILEGSGNSRLSKTIKTLAKNITKSTIVSTKS